MISIKYCHRPCGHFIGDPDLCCKFRFINGYESGCSVGIDDPA